MWQPLVAELDRFAHALLEAQTALLGIMRKKRVALTTSDTDALATLQLTEVAAAQQLQVLVNWRNTLLQSAQRHFGPCQSLLNLAHALNVPAAEAVIIQLEQARVLASELQHESWIQWVITNRCCNFYGELLELIAQGGHKSPTYHQSEKSSAGGALIDASA